MSAITITNPTRTRKWGWGWSCQPTGRNAYEIETPSAPYYTGTLNQVLKAAADDKTYHSLKGGGTYTNTAWFYAGKRITNRQDLDRQLDAYMWDKQQGRTPSPITLELADE